MRKTTGQQTLLGRWPADLYVKLLPVIHLLASLLLAHAFLMRLAVMPLAFFFVEMRIAGRRHGSSRSARRKQPPGLESLAELAAGETILRLTRVLRAKA